MNETATTKVPGATETGVIRSNSDAVGTPGRR